MNENKDKKCFIITPIGNDSSTTRRSAEGVIDAVVIPALVELGFDETNIKVAHRMPNPGSINKQIITRILEDDLAVVNLTELNPNVMYELAVRHAVRKPVIQISEKDTKLPFDINDERTVFYTNDMKGVIELKDSFITMVEEALKDEKPDNPIYRAKEIASILDNSNGSDMNFNQYLIERLDSLEANMVKIRNEKSQRTELNYEQKLYITVLAKEICDLSYIRGSLTSNIESFINGLQVKRLGGSKHSLESGQKIKVIFGLNMQLSKQALEELKDFLINQDYELFSVLDIRSGI